MESFVAERNKCHFSRQDEGGTFQEQTDGSCIIQAKNNLFEKAQSRGRNSAEESAEWKQLSY